MLRTWCAATAVAAAAAQRPIEQRTQQQAAGDQQERASISPPTIEDVTFDVFGMLDVDLSGVISHDEFQAEWQRKHIPDTALEELWGREDKNGDGQVTWAEFDGPKGNVFARLDSNADNLLTFDE
jgi:hypothetical protein